MIAPPNLRKRARMTNHLDCADELLATTRAVRKRLDFSRPVPRQLILDCIGLAQRARGLGTTLTTLHLRYEAEAAELLGIPADVSQAALLPVAYTLGDSFKPAERPAPESITFFDSWG